MSAESWHLALVDGLFLCLAAGMGLWFRAWLKREQRKFDQRLEVLEAQHARLERVSGRLQTVSRVLELMGREGTAERTTGPTAAQRERSRDEDRPTRPETAPAPRSEPPVAPTPQAASAPPASQREADFERAWQMLTEGIEPAEVAQKLDMGVAEVELMHRMLRYRRQG